MRPHDKCVVSFHAKSDFPAPPHCTHEMIPFLIATQSNEKPLFFIFGKSKTQTKGQGCVSSSADCSSFEFFRGPDFFPHVRLLASTSRWRSLQQMSRRGWTLFFLRCLLKWKGFTKNHQIHPNRGLGDKSGVLLMKDQRRRCSRLHPHNPSPTLTRHQWSHEGVTLPPI